MDHGPQLYLIVGKAKYTTPWANSHTGTTSSSSDKESAILEILSLVLASEFVALEVLTHIRTTRHGY